MEIASGTNTVGDLTLEDGATLAFNFTSRKSAPLIDLTGKDVVFGSQKSICVKITGERPWQGEHQLTSDGGFSGCNMTLDTKWSGITLLVKEDGNLYIKVARGAMVLVK